MPQYSGSKRSVWILGSSNLDYTYRVSRLPVMGMTVPSLDLRIATGGKGANQAVCAAYWGAQVHFIGAVGDDDIGEQLRGVLISHGINVELVSVIKGTTSGHAIILVDDHGSNVIVLHGGANLEVPSPGAAFSIGSDDLFVCQLENNLEAVEEHLQVAKSRGAFTILNPSPYRQLSLEALQGIDLIVANEDEATCLGCVEVKDTLAARSCGQAIRRKMAVRNVIITLGSQGAVLVQDERFLIFPGYAVKAVDTQGAGDAFLGSLVAKLSEGQVIERAVSFANWAAAQSVTRYGSTQASLPATTEASAVDLDRYSTL